jgi:hypothetical protein
LLVYLHGIGENVLRREVQPGHSSLRNNRFLPPHVLEDDCVAARFVRRNFVVAVPHCELPNTRTDWDVAPLWRNLKAFYTPRIGRGLSGDICITGVSMGGTATWLLAQAILQDRRSRFRLTALAPVDTHRPVEELYQSRSLRRVPAIGMTTAHIGRDFTLPALLALGHPKSVLFDRSRKPRFERAWDEFYRNPELYRWLAGMTGFDSTNTAAWF